MLGSLMILQLGPVNGTDGTVRCCYKKKILRTEKFSSMKFVICAPTTR